MNKPPMNFALDDCVTGNFSGHACGLVRVRTTRPLAARTGASNELASRYHADPTAAATAAEYWATAYRAMGAKPKYASSVARLREMAAATGRISVPVPLVEVYCWYSLATGIAMAGYRPERLSGQLRLTIPPPGTPFTALGQAQGSPEKTKPREVAYVDDEKAVCRYWNYRDCDETKLAAEVDDVLFVFDLVGEATDRFDEISADFACYLESGDITVGVATAVTPCVSL